MTSKPTLRAADARQKKKSEGPTNRAPFDPRMGHFYTTDKNKRTMPDKLEMKKYDPVARKHVIYKEAKIK